MAAVHLLIVNHNIVVIFDMYRFDADGVVTTFVTTESLVYHLERDKFVSGNIIFSDYSALKTTDGTDTYNIAGIATQWGYVEGVGTVARFFYIISFLQLSTDRVLITDFWNHCVRSLDRITNETLTFVGNCTNRGNKDGTDALLTRPAKIIVDIENPTRLLLAEYGGIIKSVEIANGNVSYFGTIVDYNIRSMIQEKDTGDLIVTFQHGVGLLRYQTREFSVIAGSGQRGFNDGSFNQTRFSYPNSFKFLDNYTLLVSDRNNLRLRVLNLISNTSSSVCSGAVGHADGSFSTCSLAFPRGLLILNETLYVGTTLSIRSMKGE